MRQHTGRSDWEIPEAAVSSVTILKIQVETATGKSAGI